MATQVRDHAATMDAIYRGQRHIYDLTRKYYLLGRDRAIRALGVPDGGAVLEVGCGTGRNLVQVARTYPQSRLFGLDISAEMLKSAAASVARDGVGDRTRLGRGDAVTFDPMALFGQAGFDRILMSYTLSMIPDWQGALAHALSALNPGGALVLVDFGDQAGLPGWFRSGLRAWLARFHVAPRDDLPGWLADHAVECDLIVHQTTAYRGYAMMARVTRPA